MARSRSRRRSASRFAVGPLLQRALVESLAIALAAFTLLGVLALATYAPGDPLFRLEPVANRAGALGATVAGLLHRVAGPGGGAVLLAAGAVALRLLVRRPLPGPRFWTGCVLLMMTVATLPPLTGGWLPWLGREGGWLGNRLAHWEALWVSNAGALLINALGLVVGALGVVGVSLGTALERAGSGTRALVRGGHRAAALGLAACAALAAATARASARSRRIAARALRALGVWWRRRARRAERAVRSRELPSGAGSVASASGAPSLRREASLPEIVEHGPAQRSHPEQEAFAFPETGRKRGPFRLPDLSIFESSPRSERSYHRDSLIMNSRIVEKKLLDFGVRGRVPAVHPGPVVTMYEFEPASGVKLNRIVNLSDDLALALRALSVRIIAPLPGRSVVGIEVANAERELVRLRDLLESDAFRKSRSKLTLALGKDIFGNPVVADLARMPHLLVAGATGTGKSVFLNALLCSILCRATPDELKLLLIDPKLLELSTYENIPHLITDVVTHPKRAAAALAGVVHKMEERYRMMAALGVRSIDQFNARVDELERAGETHFRLRPAPGEEEGQQLELRRLPYIVVVIDELADLMVVSARDVEESLQRLAQMARAAGIHLVLATQRPSVDVLTGVIKANFPARVSFQVSSRTDSRTILDQNGAEHLLGLGDMLFLPPGTSKLQRIHGAYVSEKEVSRLVEFLRAQGEPEFDSELLRLRRQSEAEDARDDTVDELYDRAVAIVAETRNASISYLQRRLKVGYNRAARMIERMEEEGIVGPQEGSKPREVRVRPPLDLE